MKKIISIIAILLFAGLHSQEENLGVLESDSTWKKELIKMPLGFAREINYEGFEDIRFANGWSKKESSEFWAYTFVWHVKGIQKQTEENLTTHLKAYFDGLMLPDDNDVQKISGATISFSKTKNQESSFIGTIKTYDRFHTKTTITLNCTVKAYYCNTLNTTTVLFRFSLQPFNHKVWKKFDEVTLSDAVCDD